MNEDALLEPRKAYDEMCDLHRQNSEKFFDDLVIKSGISVEENKKTIAEYKNICKQYTLETKENNKIKNIRRLILFLIILFLIFFFLFLFFGFMNQSINVLHIVLSASFLAIGIVLICLVRNKINKMISGKNLILKKLESQMQQKKNEGYKQLQPLNELYDWNMHTKIINETIPLLHLDENFHMERYQYMVEKYGLQDNNDPKKSTVFVQSGSILGNPFLLQKNFIQSMEKVPYTGSLTITWSEMVHEKDRTRMVHRSQTLMATIWKDAPTYTTETWLIYGNEAAPHLTFSRAPSQSNTMSEKEMEKYVKSFDKKLDKMVQKDMDDPIGEQFTRLANEKFEALFQAFDRNDEMEFRLLFTPLAQKNMLDLITTKEPYGDDFYFIKDLKLNYIKTKHAQYHDYIGSPKSFMDYDYEHARHHFIDYNVHYFQSLFFDLAPLISIPLYQQTKTTEYIYKEEYKSNVSSYEHEVLANSFPINLLKHPSSGTKVILKTEFLNKEEDEDQVLVHAYSFRVEDHVQHVSVFGQDGKYHHVPVHYKEFIPVLKDSKIIVKNYKKDVNDNKNGNTSQKNNKNVTIYERGLAAFLQK